MKSLADRLISPRFVLKAYIWAFILISAWMMVCVFAPFGQKLAESIPYVTFISHLALSLAFLSAIPSQVVAVRQDEDANVQDVLDMMYHAGLRVERACECDHCDIHRNGLLHPHDMTKASDDSPDS